MDGLDGTILLNVPATGTVGRHHGLVAAFFLRPEEPRAIAPRIEYMVHTWDRQ